MCVFTRLRVFTYLPSVAFARACTHTRLFCVRIYWYTYSALYTYTLEYVPFIFYCLHVHTYVGTCVLIHLNTSSVSCTFPIVSVLLFVLSWAYYLEYFISITGHCNCIKLFITENIQWYCTFGRINDSSRRKHNRKHVTLGNTYWFIRYLKIQIERLSRTVLL